jgi:SAM-dependent methyltransferase
LRYRLLDLLECPECRGGLRLWPVEPRTPLHEVETGLLECPAGHLFPVVRGIPRLLPDALRRALPDLEAHLEALPAVVRGAALAQAGRRDPAFERSFARTRASFSSEWGMVRETDRAWGLDVASRLRAFLDCFGLEASELRGKRVLDAGCGHGEVELALLKTGAEVFVVELSDSVDDVWRRLRAASPEDAGRIHIVQGSIHTLPLRERAFDLVHSAGVLHHMPDTFQGFEAVSRRVRPGGACYVEVYSAERKHPLAHGAATALRAVTVRLPHPLLHALCFAFAPLLWAYTQGANAVLGRELYRRRSLREMELSLFDGFSPRFAHHHTTPEVLGWFASLGFAGVRKTWANRNGFGVVGLRPDTM